VVVESKWHTSHELPRMMGARLWGLVYIFIANSCWGINDSVQALNFNQKGLTVMYELWLRYILATCIMFPMVVSQTGFENFRRFKWYHIWLFFGISFSLCLVDVGYWVGIYLADPLTAGVWSCVCPFASLAQGLILKTEKFNLIVFSALVIVLGGTLFQVFMNVPTDTQSVQQKGIGSFIAGNCFLLVFLLSYPCYFYFSKRLTQEGYSPIFVAMSAFFGCWFYGAINVGFESAFNKDFTWHISLPAFLYLLHWVIIGTIIPYICVTVGNAIVDTTVVVAFNAILPLFILITNCVLINLTAPPHYFIKGANIGNVGLLIVFAGLLLLVYQQKQDEQATRSKKVDEETPLISSQDTPQGSGVGGKPSE